MSLIKKSFAVVLFISLISCFILYRTGFFKESANGNSTKLIVSNFLEPLSDSQDVKKLLTINYDVVLELDTLNLKVSKKIKKTFKLRRSNDAIISSSKSAVLFVQSTTKISKDKTILKNLDQLNIVEVGFSSNTSFKGLPQDSDLLEVIELIENNKFEIDSKLEKYLDDKKMIEKYWNAFRYVATLHYGKEQSISVIPRSKIDKFLEWYDEFNKKRTTPMFSSSKSLVIADLEDLSGKAKKQLEKDREIFKQKLTEYLNIKF